MRDVSPPALSLGSGQRRKKETAAPTCNKGNGEQKSPLAAASQSSGACINPNSGSGHGSPLNR